MMRAEQEYYTLTKKAFEALAPFYDVIALPISRVREQAVSLAEARSGSRILDVATGTGAQAFAFAKAGYEVVGIDLSEAMLAVANRKNKSANVKFEIADATHLRFEDNAFDVACVSFALHDMPPGIRAKVLQEMVRVTRAKGVFVIADYALPANRVGSFLIYHLIRLYEADYYSIFIKSDLAALLKNSGVEIQAQRPVLLGAGKIWKGIKGERAA